MHVHLVEVLLALVGVAVLLGLVAARLKVPYPILLVVGGLLLALQPWAPKVELDPQLVFLLFLPPLLYAGAFRTRWPDFRDQLRAITLLAVGLVLFTTCCVAYAAHEWIGMTWPCSFILGAIVSPPDAVAALAVTQRVKVPKIITTILEGESLVNDASALVLLRIAVAAVGVTAFSPAQAILDFLIVGAGGIALGLVGGWAAVRILSWMERTDLADAKLTITGTFLVPFAVYLPAEHLHVSGVLAAVTAGLWVGNRCERVFSCDLYEEARAVWEWVEFLLESLIFLLIGLMLHSVLENLSSNYTVPDLVRYVAIVSGVVIVSRIVWMYPGAYVPRWLDQKLLGKQVKYPPPRHVFVVGWTGMRGGVSLAAALALPESVDGVPIAGRDLIQFLTFWVIFATLVGQGITLPWIIRGLGVQVKDGENGPDDDRHRLKCRPEPTEEEVPAHLPYHDSHSPGGSA